MTSDRRLQLQYLLPRYIENKATGAEEKLLFDLLENETETDGWQEIIEELMAAEAEFEGYDEKKWQDIPLSIVANTQTKRKLVAMNWRTTAVAAAIILAVFTGAFYFFKTDDTAQLAQTPNSKATNRDIAPGGDKAILTLANGRKIVLDTASNGALAQQGGIKVIKIGGVLTYDVESATDQVLYNTITTPKGGQYQLELADGTKVWLNAASSLRFPTAFVGNERRLEMTGEGYFEVAHDATKPFHVSVNGMDIQVLGTYFNINAYEDEGSMKATLLQGSVKVSAGGAEVLLEPRQQANLRGNQLSTTNNVDVEQVIAWKNGLFSFHDADIKSVMRQLARWYNVEVEYHGKIPERTFEGEMQRDLMLSQALKILEKNKVHFKTEGKKIIILP